jgi:hypothetical protein
MAEASAERFVGGYAQKKPHFNRRSISRQCHHHDRSSGSILTAQLAAIQRSVVITIQAIEHCGSGHGLVMRGNDTDRSTRQD